MPPIPRILIRLFLVIPSLAGAARAGTEEAPPADGQELKAARDLLHQAKRLLDEQYRASPTGGFRYTDGVAAALAEVADHDAAEATSRHRQPFFPDAALHVLAVGYSRVGDMPRARQTIARIQDAGPGEYKQKPRAWLHVGQALAKAGRKEWAGEAFTEAMSNSPKVSTYPSLDVDLSMEITTRGYIAEALLKAGDPASALRIALWSAQMEEVLHDAARRLAASGDMARVTDAVPRAYEEDRVALLLGAAEGLLDRGRGQPKREVVDSAKAAR